MKKKSKTEVCRICKIPINLEIEDYVHLIDYKLGKFFVEGYYHNRCYRDTIDGSKKIKALALSQLHKTNQLLNRLGGTTEYEIPSN